MNLLSALLPFLLDIFLTLGRASWPTTMMMMMMMTNVHKEVPPPPPLSLEEIGAEKAKEGERETERQRPFRLVSMGKAKEVRLKEHCFFSLF